MDILDPARSDHMVEDWDFVFSNGFMLEFTVDTTVGDSCIVNSDRTFVDISLAEKDSLTIPGTKTIAEDTTVNLSHVVCFHRRTRHIMEPTLEQKEEWKKALKSMAGKKQAYM